MNIAGIVKSSFIDYPGCASTVIFLGGCNFNCGYCHNPEIVTCGQGEITLPDFFAFLRKRKKFVDAVCISGGEPTIHMELYDLICEIREIGYKVKLDTNGTNPQLLRRLTEEGLVHHVAMDIKGPWEKYQRIARIGEGRTPSEKNSPAALGMEEAVRESLSNLINSREAGFTYELRTTVCRELLSKEDVQTMAKQLSGAALWYLQTFKKQGALLDSAGSYSAYTALEMEDLRLAAASGGTVAAVRVR